jgi:F-type H+-transporting ATPase subunit delta
MKDSLVISEIIEPYAQALMSVAQNHDLVDRIADDVSALSDLLDGSDELNLFLQNPLINLDAKKGVLRQLVSEGMHHYTLNFLMLLVDRGRAPFLGGICKQYQVLLRQLRQAVLAEVTSAMELTEEQKEAIRRKVAEMTGAHQVDLSIRIDADLIGGVIVKVGSQVVDASLRGQLRRIALRLGSSAA